MTPTSPRSILLAAALGLAATTASAQSGQAKSGTPCPPAVADTASIRYGRVFIDGKAVGGNLKVRREPGEPETYEIVDPEPTELEHLPVSKIDLIQYLKGPDAETKYRVCQGMVAIVITTKRAKRAS
jgi:hypothetical protein